MRKTHNPSLPFTIPDWSGNPLDTKGRYRNLDKPSERGFADVWKWKVRQKNKYEEQRKSQKSNVAVHSNTDFLDRSVDSITWLGHATFLFVIDGLRIMTDPILFDIWPMRRFTELPCAVEDLTDIDIILLSHNHRDHADKKSMKTITSLNPKATIYTSLGITPLLRGWKIKNPITEAGWFQSYPEFAGSQIKLTYLPARHWCRRYLHDLNRMLWGSFMIEYEGRTIYFGGDSGMGSHFDQIGDLYDIDVAILGIGAYEPEWFMRASHTSPAGALEAFEKLGAKYMIPMHYGTFDLSDEPVFNPKNRLTELSKSGSLSNQILVNDIGRRWALGL